MKSAREEAAVSLMNSVPEDVAASFTSFVLLSTLQMNLTSKAILGGKVILNVVKSVLKSRIISFRHGFPSVFPCS